MPSIRFPELAPRLTALALAGALLACGRPVPRAEIPERLAALGPPNLVLILCDTLRADFTSPYGFARDTSPELAAWAARGALFERVRSQSSWTKMSMASLLTSLWPRSHGIREAQDGLDRSAVTLAEEGADHPAVHRGQARIADDRVPEGQHAELAVVVPLQLEADELRVRDPVDQAHRDRSASTRFRGCSVGFAPTMKVPMLRAKGSSGSRSQALPRTNATLRVRL